MNLPKVSIIITTKDEEKNIANCLDSIKNQTYPQEKIELIVVDNNSTDRTKEIARKYTDKVFNKGPERSAQRNFGVRKSRGKYILYLDADMILSGEVISECVDKCENGKVALYIPEKIMGEKLWIKIRDYERSFYDGTCIDAVRFIRRDVFLKVGGFDQKLVSGEDWDLERRIKSFSSKFDRIDSLLYHNEGGLTLREYLQKKSYYSNLLKKYIEKWGSNDPIVKKQIGIQYRLFTIFMENGKWKRFIRNLHLAIGVISLRLMVGIVFFITRIKNYLNELR